MPFSLNAQATTSEITDAVNYLLSNFGSNVVVDSTSGIVAGPTGLIGYYYKYLSIKYADSYDGSVGFSNSPTNKAYYGLRNSNSSVESTNPDDYIWTKATGGFGTTKFLWYATSGGRQISIVVATTAPAVYYVQDNGSAIDLDVITFTSTLQTTTQAIYQWTNSSTAPTRPSTFSTYTWATNSFIAPTGWYSSIPGGSTPGQYLWAIFISLSVNSNVTTSTLDWTNSSYPIVLVGTNGTTGPTGTTGTTGSTGPTGTPANQNATVYLYQWSNTTPGNPNGSSTFTWSTGLNSAYTGTNGWLTYIPTNPGTPNTYLWQASKGISDVATATTTTVNWSSGFAVTSISQNGSSGTTGPTGPSGSSPNKTANASVYQWALSTPTISGTSTYTWSSSSFTPNPTGWSNTITSAPAGGYYLYTATVSFSDAASATTTTINWTTSSIVISGYASLNGASSRICYARVAGSPSPTAGNITTSGSSSFPTATQSNSTWGLNYTWYASDPSPTSTNSLYQSDGTYDPSTGNTVWNTPYLSSLKVGELSAITVNAGQITVSSPSTGAGYIKAGTVNYSSGTMTGYGGIINQDGTFAFGNASAGNFTYDGTNFNVGGSANLSVTGQVLFNGLNTSTYPVYVNGVNYTVQYSEIGVGLTSPASTSTVRTGNVGVSDSFNAKYNVGSIGIGLTPSGTTNGIGVVGTGDLYGGYFDNGNSTTAYGLVANQSNGNVAFAVSNGTMAINNNSVVNNLYAQYAQTMVGSTADQLTFNQGSTTGAGVATFNATNKPGSSSTNTWIEVYINSTLYFIPVWT
jgi:hypothetical protein